MKVVMSKHWTADMVSNMAKLGETQRRVVELAFLNQHPQTAREMAFHMKSDSNNSDFESKWTPVSIMRSLVARGILTEVKARPLTVQLNPIFK